MPDDREWRAAFFGALRRLTKQTHWERDAAHNAKTVAARWLEVYQEAETMACCTPTQLDRTVNINSYSIQALAYAQIVRQLWIDNSNDVNLAFYQVPDTFSTDAGDAGAEIDAREAALCFAAQSFVHETFNQGMNLILAETEEFIAVSAAAAQASTALPVIGTVVVLGAIVITGVSAVLVFEQLSDEDYREYIACNMFDNLSGLDPDVKADFDQSLDTITGAEPGNPTIFEQAARRLIEFWIQSQVNNLDNYLIFVRNLNAAMDFSLSTSDQCSCLGEWTHEWLNGFNSSDDWSLVGYSAGLDPGTYDAVEDRWDGDCVGPADGVGMRAEITFPSRVITSISVTTTWNATRASSGNKTELGDTSDTDRWASCSHGTGVGTHICETGSISQAMTAISIRAFAGSNNCSEGAYSRITRVTISGDGVDPFL